MSSDCRRRFRNARSKHAQKDGVGQTNEPISQVKEQPLEAQYSGPPGGIRNPVEIVAHEKSAEIHDAAQHGHGDNPQNRQKKRDTPKPR